MKTIYGHFDDLQLTDYKVKLHKELFWLLLYKDPETRDQYKNIDFDIYFDFLMKQIDGLNTLLSYPTQIVKMMSLLEAALIESRKEYFNYKSYRKLILDAHKLVDELWEVNENNEHSGI